MESCEYSLHLLIDAIPHALNKTLRAHYHKNNKENKKWDIVINAYCVNKRPPKPLSKASIKIIRHSQRMLDYDGLVGSMKPVVDGLRYAGIILDDRWSVTGRWDIDQKFRPKKDGPLLEIFVNSCK